MKEKRKSLLDAVNRLSEYHSQGDITLVTKKLEDYYRDEDIRHDLLQKTHEETQKKYTRAMEVNGELLMRVSTHEEKQIDEPEIEKTVEDVASSYTKEGVLNV